MNDIGFIQIAVVLLGDITGPGLVFAHNRERLKEFCLPPEKSCRDFGVRRLG